MGVESARRLLPVLMPMRTLVFILSLWLPLMASSQMGTPIGNDLGRTQFAEKKLKEAFLGNRAIWNSGQSVVIVLTNTQSASFEKTAAWALNADAFDYQKHWLSIVFQGRADAPVFVKDEKEMISYVREHPGAIGILHQETAPDDLVIRVE